MDVTLSMHGRPQRYVLSAERLTVNDRVIELASIARVRLAKLGEMQICELTPSGDKPTVIANEDPAKRVSYAELVTELHVRIHAAGARAGFVRGSWLLVGVLASIGVLAIVFALALYLRWIEPPPILAGKALLIMVMGAVWTVLGPLLVWRSRPQPYDPLALPRGLLH